MRFITDPNESILPTAHETLIRLILPEGILDYFELTNVAAAESGQLNIYLEEKNLPPAGYDARQLESKGFLPETAIQDFPIRGHKVALCIKPFFLFRLANIYA
ncbi:hypothetical protein GCM10023149_21210 [Mucilaginibacter gynuensis]|uniref:Transposase n=1 Tax=Mucilaginibacter gynuensis TaxID=1302236 RepID=A0ABP8GBR1_9SPHI